MPDQPHLDEDGLTPEQRARAEAIDRTFRSRVVVPARRKKADPGWRWICLHPPVDEADGALMYQAFDRTTGELTTRPLGGQEAARLLHSQGLDTWSISVRLRSAEMDLNTNGSHDGAGRMREAHAIRQHHKQQGQQASTKGATP